MNNFFTLLILACLVICISFVASATDNTQLPQIRFLSTLDDEHSFDLIKQSALFSKLTKDAPGAPIRLVSFVQTSATSGGAAASFTSMMLSAGTLGVVPVVSNDDVTITYRMFVNGTVLLEYSYTENFTDADFFWAMDFTLSDDAKKWAASTVEQFLVDVEKDESLMQLAEEYEFYFSEL